MRGTDSYSYHAIESAGRYVPHKRPRQGWPISLPLLQLGPFALSRYLEPTHAGMTQWPNLVLENKHCCVESYETSNHPRLFDFCSEQASSAPHVCAETETDGQIMCRCSVLLYLPFRGAFSHQSECTRNFDSGTNAYAYAYAYAYGLASPFPARCLTDCHCVGRHCRVALSASKLHDGTAKLPARL